MFCLCSTKQNQLTLISIHSNSVRHVKVSLKAYCRLLHCLYFPENLQLSAALSLCVDQMSEGTDLGICAETANSEYDQLTVCV